VAEDGRLKPEVAIVDTEDSTLCVTARCRSSTSGSR
jgi:hypothetical protein